jgi:hypothetical protein
MARPKIDQTIYALLVCINWFDSLKKHLWKMKIMRRIGRSLIHFWLISWIIFKFHGVHVEKNKYIYNRLSYFINNKQFSHIKVFILVYVLLGFWEMLVRWEMGEMTIGFYPFIIIVSLTIFFRKSPKIRTILMRWREEWWPVIY